MKLPFGDFLASDFSKMRSRSQNASVSSSRFAASDFCGASAISAYPSVYRAKMETAAGESSPAAAYARLVHVETGRCAEKLLALIKSRGTSWPQFVKQYFGVIRDIYWNLLQRRD